MNTTALPFKGKTICVVNTATVKKKFILQRLKKLGFTVVVLNKEKNWAAPYVDHWIIADTFNHSDAVLAFRNFVKTHPKVRIDGVITFWEDDVLLTAKLVDRFNLIGIPYDIARRVRNKYLFREFCRMTGLPVPSHHIIRTARDIKYIISHFTFPLVVKPAFGATSAYVMRVDEPAQLPKTIEYIREHITTDTESALADGFDLFVEEYIDGDEVDIDMLLQNGKVKFYSIADNYDKSFGQFFIDKGQAIPSSLPNDAQEALLTMAEETLEKLGITDGCIHFEAKMTKHGPVPLEVNMRMGGDYVYSYTKSAWGVDLIEQAARIAIGDYIKITKPDEPRRYIVGWDLQPESSGILVELDVAKELAHKKYIEEIHLFKEIGDPMLRPPEGYDSLGWLTVHGDNTLDAQDNLRDALRFINYKVAAFDEESALGKTSRKDSLSAAVFKKNLLLQKAKLEKVRSLPLKNQRQLHIGIAANLSNQASDDHRTVVRDIEKQLHERGYTTTIFDFDNVSLTLLDVRFRHIDLVLNVAEGVGSSDSLKPHAAALLEVMKIPYTGTSSLNLGLARDKIRAKKLLTYHDIPTPTWDYAYTINDSINPELQYPLIVKPADTDHSFGITNASVVKNKKELQIQLKRVIADLGHPALVEEYVEGEEYSVSILGSDYNNLKILPLGRSLFKNVPTKHWRIHTETSKSAGAPHSFSARPLKSLNPKLESLISEIALDTYQIMNCRDYGRVEVRVDKEGNPYVLELNPNPILDKTSLLVRAAKCVDMDYGDVLEEIIRSAITRYQREFTR